MHDRLLGLLHRQHEVIEEILDRMANGASENPIDRQGILGQLQAALRPHVEAEQAVLYPPLREMDEVHDQAVLGLEQHRAATSLLDEIRSMGPTDGEWKARAQRLKSLVAQHIAFEEDEVFPQVRTLISESSAGQIVSRLESEENRVLLQLHVRS